MELVDGSNCTIAADGFATPAPIYCLTAGTAMETTKAPGADRPRRRQIPVGWQPDHGYSNDVVRPIHFEQIAAMRANLYEVKADYLYNQTPLASVSTAPFPLPPLQDELVQYDAAYLEWEPLENATHYLVQVSPVPSFTGALPAITSLIPTPSLCRKPTIDRNYYWRVRGYNSHSFCNPATKFRGFARLESRLSATYLRH